MKKTTVLSGLTVLSIFTLTGCGNFHSTSGDSQTTVANQSTTNVGKNTTTSAQKNTTTNVVTTKNDSSTTGTSTPPAAVSITSNSSSTISDEHQQFASTIQQLLTNPKGAPVDCSALVQFVYAQAGLKMPRTVSEQATVGTRVNTKDQLKYGDIVFFDLSSKPNVATIDGIYIGDNQFVAKTTHGIMSIDINSTYWRDKFLFGQHV